MARKLVHNITKIIIFAFIMSVVMLSVKVPDKYISQNLVKKLALFISGDVNSESMYDAYFYIDLATVILITSAIYFFTMKLFKKLRSK
ncbi:MULTISPECIES: hypothetical protein [Pantoea]|nr:MULTISPECIES: hypothetical protein [Pantoea]